MPEQMCITNVDLADVWEDVDRKVRLRTLAWGDQITVTNITEKHVEVEVLAFQEQPDGSILTTPTAGFIVPRASSGVAAADVVVPVAENRVLRVNFLDVQQGDAAVVESPSGKVVLIDGGENQMFARYLAARFHGTSSESPKVIDCIVVSHGDADHFAGLPEILESETNKKPNKRLFVEPKRVFHNGIVKRPSRKDGNRVKDLDLLGPTTATANGPFLTDLADDLLVVPDAEMNREFVRWKRTLAAWNERSPIEFRRLSFGDTEAFDWFSELELSVEVLGPITTDIAGHDALKFLGTPPSGPFLGHESVDAAPAAFGSPSASHTINGHSVALRIVYGGFSYLFTGDLNDEASRFLVQQHRAGQLNLRSDVLKVPHHGSADFSGAFLGAVEPIVSVVSSGDESVAKEYIHPRATLVGALGRYSRVDEPLIFVTELVAFFQVEGWSKQIEEPEATKRGTFFGFSRAAFGAVKTRTDGTRLFVFTDSGNIAMKEAYAFVLDGAGVPQPTQVVKV